MIFLNGQDPRLNPYASADNLARIAELQAAVPPVATACGAPGLSVLILTLNRADLIIPQARDLGLVAEACAAAGLGFEAIIGDTGSTEPELLAFYDALPAHMRVVRGLKYQFSRCNNQLAEQARFDMLLFLNNDVILSDGPLAVATLDRHLRDHPEVGVGGLALWFPDGRPQHAGIDFFKTGPARGLCFHPLERPPEGPGAWTCPAATGAALMMRREVFVAAGGFDEKYRTECQDVALCLAAHRLGYRTDVVAAGHPVHLENATRPKGSEDWEDRQRLFRRWGSYVLANFL